MPQIIQGVQEKISLMTVIKKKPENFTFASTWHFTALAIVDGMSKTAVKKRQIAFTLKKLAWKIEDLPVINGN